MKVNGVRSRGPRRASKVEADKDLTLARIAAHRRVDVDPDTWRDAFAQALEQMKQDLAASGSPGSSSGAGQPAADLEAAPLRVDRLSKPEGASRSSDDTHLAAPLRKRMRVKTTPAPLQILTQSGPSTSSADRDAGTKRNHECMEGNSLGSCSVQSCLCIARTVRTHPGLSAMGRD